MAPAAASARPATSRGSGSSWRRRRPPPSLGDVVGELRALEEEQARRGAAELAGDDQSVARPGAGPRHQVSADPAWPTTVIARMRTGARVTSPPARRPGLGGGGGEPVDELEAIVLVEVVGHTEQDVGLAGLGAHRREVGERDGERLAADRSEDAVSRRKWTPSTRASTEVAVAPPGTVTAASSPLPIRTCEPQALRSPRAPATASLRR